MKRYRNYIALCVAGICTLCTPLVSCNDDLKMGLGRIILHPDMMTVRGTCFGLC